MSRNYLPVSDHRFKKSPFFSCNDREDTLYGIYNNRLYPISSGVNEREHYENLRSRCCLYDVPETPLRVRGPDSLQLLDELFTRRVSGIKVGKAGYAIACNHNGGVVMDGVLMRPNDQEFIYVQANGDFLNWASAIGKKYDAEIEDFDSWALQIQGPTSLQVLEKLAGMSIEDFPYYAVSEIEILGKAFLVSRSGWTGERGFELYSRDSNFNGADIWNELLRVGADDGLMASDVSSMHVRRIEAGILDYGTDIDQSLNPYEIGLGRLLHLDKENFVGKQALEATNRTELLLRGVKTQDYAPERDDRLFDENGIVIGRVTAGAYSYSLGYGIGFARLQQPLDYGTQVFVGTAIQKHSGEITKTPFLDPDRKLIR